MWNLVKGLREIEQYCIDLLFVIEAFGKVIDGEE